MAKIPDINQIRLRSQLSVPDQVAATLKNIGPSPLIQGAQQNWASEFHKRLMTWIQEFDASLDDEHEVGVRLVSFGQTVVFHLASIGYWNPSLITMSGTTDSGEPVELIQHVSQISVLLMKVARRNPEEPKNPIGFRVPSDEAKAEGS